MLELTLGQEPKGAVLWPAPEAGTGAGPADTSTRLLHTTPTRTN
jgi:hypothetical protein